ncbi:paraquat-inducible protein A [Leisingera caerulea]|uniref:Paraquat-inducible protein A n=1 Tax=Leisingera caerulea TaxID=506591 RepID=A0ABY5WZ17_LEICA|nr:paraquat-inducible protein A [Leisingera caerulea]UWQ50691.1 paraquat-inducible protein A [Leisingera caerulea]UWQ59381.1 paraquat-inducible protein A [Leisingera caerulea]UWQ63511.1 paraquat-inducible protein A [Leisingera caerulea]UWQ84414.1 paraquat-inducible protein A [Leisingera caerulea]
MDLEQLIACPACDVLHRNQDVAKHTVARCARCGTVLAAPKSGAMTRIAMLSLTALILLAAAAGFPFLELQAQGLSHRASVLDAVLAFSSGPMAPLSLATGFLIVLLPAARYGALVYTLAPMALGWHPAPHAAAVYRWAERLKPWAMAEIFIIGVAVALVKVSGLARVGLGPAFWAFAALLVVTILTDSSICRLTVWKTLKTRRGS